MRRFRNVSWLIPVRRKGRQLIEGEPAETVMGLEDRHRLRKPAIGWVILAGLASAMLWILFVGGTRAHEMMVGAAVLVLSVAFIFRVGQMETLNLDLQAVDLVTCWRIPWYIISGSYEIASILVKDLIGKKAGSFYRFCGFKTSRHEPRAIARRVLATAYTTTAPNFIVIGIDYAQSRMLFHQLDRSDVPRMTKELGAQPGADRS